MENIRLENFSNIEDIQSYICAYNPNGEAAIFNSQKELLFYENFDIPGYLTLYHGDIMWNYLFGHLKLLLVIWNSKYGKISGIYSFKEHSYIVPLGKYTTCEDLYTGLSDDEYYQFIIGGGLSCYFILHKKDSMSDMSVEKISLCCNSQIIDFSSRLVIFRQTEKPNYLSVYLRKEKKFIIPFKAEIDTATPEKYGIIVTKNGQFGLYSFTGDILIPFSDDSIVCFNRTPDKWKSPINVVKKITIKNEKQLIGAYTYNNECIVPQEAANIYLLSLDGLLLVENYDLSYTVYSIKSRKPIIPPSLGILIDESENMIKAVKYMRLNLIPAHDKYDDDFDKITHEWTRESTGFVSESFSYSLCYDLYSHDGELIKSNIIETGTSGFIPVLEEHYKNREIID